MLNTVLLLESDKTVVEDVVCSMRLLDIPVQVVDSVEDAIKELKKNRPSIFLTRKAAPKDPNAAVKLVAIMRKDKSLKAVPVVLLCDKAEQSEANKHQNLFDGLIRLPVEFPAFTQEVQDIYSEAALRAEPMDLPEEGEIIETLQNEEQKLEISEDTGDYVEDFDRRMMIAYGIQVAVLDALRDDLDFTSIPLSEVPKRIAEITAQLCNRY